MEIVPRFNIFIRCFDISINPNMFIIAKLKWNFISKDITKHSEKTTKISLIVTNLCQIYLYFSTFISVIILIFLYFYDFCFTLPTSYTLKMCVLFLIQSVSCRNSMIRISVCYTNTI